MSQHILSFFLRFALLFCTLHSTLSQTFDSNTLSKPNTTETLTTITTLTNATGQPYFAFRTIGKTKFVGGTFSPPTYFATSDLARVTPTSDTTGTVRLPEFTIAEAQTQEIVLLSARQGGWAISAVATYLVDTFPPAANSTLMKAFTFKNLDTFVFGNSKGFTKARKTSTGALNYVSVIASRIIGLNDSTPYDALKCKIRVNVTGIIYSMMLGSDLVLSDSSLKDAKYVQFTTERSFQFKKPNYKLLTIFGSTELDITSLDLVQCQTSSGVNVSSVQVDSWSIVNKITNATTTKTAAVGVTCPSGCTKCDRNNTCLDSNCLFDPFAARCLTKTTENCPKTIPYALDKPTLADECFAKLPGAIILKDLTISTTNITLGPILNPVATLGDANDQFALVYAEIGTLQLSSKLHFPLNLPQKLNTQLILSTNRIIFRFANYAYNPNFPYAPKNVIGIKLGAQTTNVTMVVRNLTSTALNSLLNPYTAIFDGYEFEATTQFTVKKNNTYLAEFHINKTTAATTYIGFRVPAAKMLIFTDGQAEEATITNGALVYNPTLCVAGTPCFMHIAFTAQNDGVFQIDRTLLTGSQIPPNTRPIKAIVLQSDYVCPPGAVIKSNPKLCECDDGYYPNTGQNVACTLCNTDCKTCFNGTNTTCLSCYNPFVLVNNSCVCPTGYKRNGTQCILINSTTPTTPTGGNQTSSNPSTGTSPTTTPNNGTTTGGSTGTDPSSTGEEEDPEEEEVEEEDDSAIIPDNGTGSNNGTDTANNTIPNNGTSNANITNPGIGDSGTTPSNNTSSNNTTGPDTGNNTTQTEPTPNNNTGTEPQPILEGTNNQTTPTNNTGPDTSNNTTQTEPTPNNNTETEPQPIHEGTNNQTTPTNNTSSTNETEAETGNNSNNQTEPEITPNNSTNNNTQAEPNQNIGGSNNETIPGNSTNSTSGESETEGNTNGTIPDTGNGGHTNETEPETNTGNNNNQTQPDTGENNSATTPNNSTANNTETNPETSNENTPTNSTANNETEPETGGTNNGTTPDAIPNSNNNQTEPNNTTNNDTGSQPTNNGTTPNTDDANNQSDPTNHENNNGTIPTDNTDNSMDPTEQNVNPSNPSSPSHPRSSGNDGELSSENPDPDNTPRTSTLSVLEENILPAEKDVSWIKIIYLLFYGISFIISFLSLKKYKAKVQPTKFYEATSTATVNSKTSLKPQPDSLRMIFISYSPLFFIYNKKLASKYKGLCVFHSVITINVKLFFGALMAKALIHTDSLIDLQNVKERFPTIVVTEIAITVGFTMIYSALFRHFRKNPLILIVIFTLGSIGMVVGIEISSLEILQNSAGGLLIGYFFASVVIHYILFDGLLALLTKNVSLVRRMRKLNLYKENENRIQAVSVASLQTITAEGVINTPTTNRSRDRIFKLFKFNTRQLAPTEPPVPASLVLES